MVSTFFIPLFLFTIFWYFIRNLVHISLPCHNVATISIYFIRIHCDTWLKFLCSIIHYLWNICIHPYNTVTMHNFAIYMLVFFFYIMFIFLYCVHFSFARYYFLFLFLFHISYSQGWSEEDRQFHDAAIPCGYDLNTEPL